VRAAWILVSAAVGAAAWLGVSVPTASLPFYDTGDFTPRWVSTSHSVGDFSLLDQNGNAFTAGDVAGRVYVASFIYTRCSSICPTLVGNLRRVDRTLNDGRFRIVSFSVTPDLDPPRVLKAFGDERQIDRSRWILATGDKSEVFRLAREKYFASDEVLARTLADPDAFLHTEKLVLVDATGRLRGVYDGTLAAEVDHLIDDARGLLGY
jgi:protein SCO1/2